MTGFIARWLQARNAAQQAQQAQAAALAAAVDQVATRIDPKLRLVSRYQEKLGPAVERSLRYIDELIAALPAPIAMNRAAWIGNPYVKAFFATVDDMRAAFSHSAELRKFFEQNIAADEAYVTLMMRRETRKVLGMKLTGEVIQRETPQQTVSFSEHRIGAAGATEAAAREELQRRALNFLAGWTLDYILSLRSQRDELEEQRRILKLRLKMLQTRREGLESLTPEGDAIESELNALSKRLIDNKEDLKEARIQVDELDDYLRHAERILGEPEQYLRMDKVVLRINHLGVVLDADSTELGDELTLYEFSSPKALSPFPSEGAPVEAPTRRRIITLARYRRDDMLSQADLFAKASRYLLT